MNIEKRKRELEDNNEEIQREVKLRKDKNSSSSFLINIPNELLDLITSEINRKEIIALSTINRVHRNLLYLNIFKDIKLKWKEIEIFLEQFKQLDIVKSIRIICDLNNEKEANNGEWNVSFKKLFELCNNLNELKIELLTSGRCLKYKDDFDVEFSDKIENITLISNSKSNNGSVNDKAMFELTQLQRFHRIKKLILKGFTVSKDTYFYPKIKEDMSDYNKRSLDGKLIELKELKLVNCAWEYPVNLNDVFLPEYPIPGNTSLNMNKNCKIEKLGLYYSNEYIQFTACERFKNFIDNDNNDRFLFEIGFFKELKELEIVILNKMNKNSEITCYYPWIDMINLRREFYVDDRENGGGMIRQSILCNLEKLILVGWWSSSVQELDKCFKISKDINKINMKHIEIYLMKNFNNNNNNFEEDQVKINDYQIRLQGIFGDECYVKVGLIDECYDGRYDSIFEGSK